MRKKALTMSLLAAVMGIMTWGQAHVQSLAACPSACPLMKSGCPAPACPAATCPLLKPCPAVSACPPACPTVTACPAVTACPTACPSTALVPACPSVGVSAVREVPVAACPSAAACTTALSADGSAIPLAGQVQSTGIAAETQKEGWAPWGERYKTLTLTPGPGQFSIDRLGPMNKVALTLVNPTDVPLRFETTQRLGKEQSVVVPPHGQQQLTYSYNNPVSDEVKFLVYEEPSNAMCRNAEHCRAASIPVQTVQPIVTLPAPPTAIEVPIIPEAPQPSSAVRGYW